MTPQQHRGLLPTLFLGVLLAALDIAVLGPALPAIGSHFQVDERTLAWAFNTFVFFNLLGVPVMTKLSDRHGRRLVYLVDVGLFAVGALIVVLAPSYAVLLVGRALQGLGASGIFPVASAVVGDAFPKERRGRALGILGAVFGVAFLIGPILAGVLLLVDWRLIYVAYLPLAVTVMIMGARRLPASTSPDRKPLDWPGLALLGMVLVSLAYAVNRVDAARLAQSLEDPRVWGAVMFVLVGLPLFVLRERRAEDPVVRPGLFRDRQVIIAAALAGAAGLSESAFIFLPGLAIEAFGVSASTASFMLLPLVGSIVIASPVAGRILDRIGSRLVVLACQAILVAGIGLLAWKGHQLLWFYVGTVLFGAGLAGIMGPALSYILLAAASVSERGVSQGLITLFISVGQLVGSAGIGAVAASVAGSEGYQLGLLAIAACGGVAWLAALALRARRDA
ncbi:MAG: MFS transporter [Rhodothermales bacterium]|nr:MFS transporter [Rhodothermales bacterium]MBO6781290.1 MFS transporter [Rhodothermales bacterium]